MSDDQNSNARAALLGAAHDALSALTAFEAVMAEHENAWIGATIARPLMKIRSAAGGVIGMIEDWLPPAERTQEVVLRAMLRAYEATALEAETAYQKRLDSVTDHDDARPESRAAEQRKATWLSIFLALGTHLAGAKFDLSRPVLADYEARLRVERPLDAPPMEAP